MALPLVEQLIDISLLEDLAYGDITSDSLFPTFQMGEGIIRTRQSAVVSGIDVAKRVFQKIDPDLEMISFISDGDAVTPGQRLLQVKGNVGSILQGERLALNFLQHLSGIATLTYQFAGAIAGTKAKVVHTRKTTPGLRHLEIQAVLHGGGSSHRKSLSHAVLIKDNHIAAAGSIQRAIEKTRQHAGHTMSIEVECDTLAQVSEALSAKADIILLDNMAIPMLKEAVQMIGGQAITEASGGVTLSNILGIAQTGVDYISTSQITLGATPIDLGLDFDIP